MIFKNDIIDVKGKFLTYQSMVDQFGQFISNYNYICLKDAVPKTWRKILTFHTILNMVLSNEAIYIMMNKHLKPVKLVKSKEVYWMFNKRLSAPKCIKTWFEKYLIDYSEIKWKIFLI